MSAPAKPKLVYAYISQPSRAVRWFVAKHKIDVEHEVIQLAQLQSPEITARNAWQQVPFLEVDGQCLTESAAIMGFLATVNNIESEYPSDPLQRAKIHEMLFKHENMGRAITMNFFRPMVGFAFKMFSREQALAQIAANAGAKGKDVLHLFEWTLGRSTYIAGEKFTIADYLVVCELNQLEAMEKVPGLLPADCHLSNFPKTLEYLTRVQNADPLAKAHYAETEKFVTGIFAAPAEAAPAATTN